MSRALSIVFVVSCTWCCARSPELVEWSRQAAHAERLLEQGRYKESRRVFEQLSARAHFEGDVVYSQVRRAQAFSRERRYPEAVRLLNKLLKEQKDGDRELYAKLLYLRARVDLDRGKKEHGERLLDRLVQHYPKTTFGHRSFLLLRGRLRSRDRQAYVDWCRERYPRLRDTPLADNLLYEAARVYFEQETAEGNRKAAPLYAKIRTRWHFHTSPLWDDATWDLSLVRHRQGRYEEEIHLLRELLDTREPTWLWGSYDIGNYKHAAFRIAMVHYRQFHNYERAARLFHRFPEHFRKSRFRDDALWWEGQSWLRAGKETEAIRAFETLVNEHPNSRYTQRVRDEKLVP
jgi:outer membrane protein assembly factor BamD (BamD/ComL family)